MKKIILSWMIVTGFLLLALPTNLIALDTEAYQVNSQQNTTMLLDNSGSMQYGVYENAIDYAAAYENMSGLSTIDASSKTDIPEGTIDRYQIYLLKGTVSGDGDPTTVVWVEGGAFTNDAGAVPITYSNGINWDLSNAIPTYATIENGAIEPIDTTNVILQSVSGQIQVKYTGNDSGSGNDIFAPLPHNLGIPEHDYQTVFDGTNEETLDTGFVGLLKAPGYFFSGLKGDSSALIATEGTGTEQEVFFFVTGNWINYQRVCALEYNTPKADGSRPWQNETISLATETELWVDEPITYEIPQGDTYDSDITKLISFPTATEIKLHFSEFDLGEDGDVLKIYQGDSTHPQNLLTSYSSMPLDGWTDILPSNNITLLLATKNQGHGTGITIDKVSYQTSYTKIKSRYDVAKNAITYVLDNFSEEINWGFAFFADSCDQTNKDIGPADTQCDSYSDIDGANIQYAPNPTISDDQNRQNIQSQVDNLETFPSGGTPLGEALQDVFVDAYYKNIGLVNAGTKKAPCSRNYAVVLSDGFPSVDEEWSRISGVDFSNYTPVNSDFMDGGFTYDPAQYSTPSRDYYDAVANYMYTHSWIDKSVISDPSSSYDNIITHHIAFGTENPLLKYAAQYSGGIYLVAYNQNQLMYALYTVAQMIGQSISFTAPAVSVDAENKSQNGDELYMGLFLPRNSQYWVGNLRKFVYGDGTSTYYDEDGNPTVSDIWQIYDGDFYPATETDVDNPNYGEYLYEAAGFWRASGVSSINTSSGTKYGVNVLEDGVGEVLTQDVRNDFAAGNYYDRKIRIISRVDGSSLVPFTADNFTNDDLTDGTITIDDATKAKIINWTYGYAFDGTIDAPTAPRDWALGPIVHSRPVIIDYYNNSNASVLEHRYVAIGAGDGKLHIFDEGTGTELLAFIPDDALQKLYKFAPEYLETSYNNLLVDGSISIVRYTPEGSDISQPKYLLFSQRRGGGSVVALDIENSDPTSWTLAWEFTDPEMVQSWSSIETAKIQTDGDPETGEGTYTSVAIFTGGYDPMEDDFPEPFYDSDNDGEVGSNEWSNSTDDKNNNNTYDTHNVDGDNYGRALYVVALQDFGNYSAGDLIFSIKNTNSAAHTNTGTGTPTEIMTDLFKYCFPADPAVIVGETNEHLAVLRAIYVIDVYGNIFRINYNYAGESVVNPWSINHIFATNPGSLSASGTMAGGEDTEDVWRKAFYSPSVSWGGSGYYFDNSNYSYSGVDFNNTGKIASLFFGTGDRVHPTYNIASDRIYAVYDDSSITAENKTTGAIVAVSSIPYTEDDLLNLTCDELGQDTGLSGYTSTDESIYKTSLQTLLRDDVKNLTTTDPMELDTSGYGENDAKGWYIILEEQGDASYCSHCDYLTELDNDTTEGRDNHFGEKIISRLTLYAGVLYFNSYQRNFDDPCVPAGNSLYYAINYLNGSAAYNLNTENDYNSDDTPSDEAKKDVSDRYGKITNIKALPATIAPVYRKGQTRLQTPGLKDLDISERDRPIYYWIEK